MTQPPEQPPQSLAERELALKRDELDWKKATQEKSWKSPLVIAVVAGALALGGTLAKSFHDSTTAFQLAEATRMDPNPIALVVVEQGKLIDLVNMQDIPARDRLLCEHRSAGTFQTETAVSRLNGFVEARRLCRDAASGDVLVSDDPQVSPPSDPCTTPTFVASTCRAYDKSGFNSRPSGSCQIDLAPSADHVFNVALTEFSTQVLRNLAGDPVERAIKPALIAGSPNFADRFSGTIRCTNDRGTGRTCEHIATVRAAQVPASCMTAAG